jgi:hypothetical protein
MSLPKLQILEWLLQMIGGEYDNYVAGRRYAGNPYPGSHESW